MISSGFPISPGVSGLHKVHRIRMNRADASTHALTITAVDKPQLIYSHLNPCLCLYPRHAPSIPAIATRITPQFTAIRCPWCRIKPFHSVPAHRQYHFRRSAESIIRCCFHGPDIALITVARIKRGHPTRFMLRSTTDRHRHEVAHACRPHL